MSKSFLSADQIRFIDDLAALLTAWNMPNNAARLYGYLQLQNAPASLDDIVRDLEISKSNACTAAKVLEDHGNARRLGTRGSKRIFYVAGDDPGAPLRKQTDLLGRMSTLISSRTEKVSCGRAAVRLTELADFHKSLQLAMEAVIRPEEQNNRV